MKKPAAEAVRANRSDAEKANAWDSPAATATFVENMAGAETPVQVARGAPSNESETVAGGVPTARSETESVADLPSSATTAVAGPNAGTGRSGTVSMP